MKPLPGKISICAKHDLDAFSRERVTHILAIEDPQTPRLVPAWFKGVHQQIQFHDVESLKQAREYNAVPPDKNHVQEILRFGKSCFDDTTRPTHLLIHCHAGACRSPAAAFAIIMQHWGAGHATAALEHILQIRPVAFPNRLVVKYADDLLGLNGEMLRALAPLREQFNKELDEWLASRNQPPEQTS